MKRNSVLKGIAVSVALSAFLTGCGGSDASTSDNTNNNTNTQPTSITGKAVDGYLQYATVCLDLNNDGYCQNSEPNTQTDTEGKFTLEIAPKVQENSNYEKAMLLVYGGKDVDTGTDFTGKLLAPKEGTTVIVTPVSTLVAKTVQKELQAKNNVDAQELEKQIRLAKQKVAEALDIPEEELDKDPIKEQKKGNDKLIQKALQLQKAVEVLTMAAPQADADDQSEKIYEALIAGLEDMQAGEKGVDALLEKTFQKADKDPKVKELLGGNYDPDLANAAKKVADNIQSRFAGFDENAKKSDDFLQKIADGTKEDLHKVKEAHKEGKIKEVIGQIGVDDDIFKPNFDWSKKYIATDLKLIEIDPTDDLIEAIKTALGSDKIKPGTIFEKYQKLASSDSQEVQNVYQRIKRYIAEQKKKEEIRDGKSSDEILKLTPGMTFYMPEKEGYGKVSLGNDTLSFQKYKIQQDGTFAAETPDDEDDIEIIFKDGQWVELNEYAPEKVTFNEDGSINLSNWQEKAYLLKGKDIAGKTKSFPQYNVDVAMPDDAQMYYIKIEKLNDVYTLHEKVTNHNNNEETPFTSIGEFISTQCGTHWFEGDHNGGIAFAGTKTEYGYECNAEATEGKLVYAYEGMDINEPLKEAGTWEIKTLSDNSRVLVVKPNDKKMITDDEGDLEYPIFAEKDGYLYRGDMEPKGLERIMPAYNESALNAVTNTITNAWETIQNNLPFDFNKGDNVKKIVQIKK